MSEELTELPEGWEPATLGNVIELKYGKGLTKSSRKSGQYSVYGSNGVVGAHSTFVVNQPCLVVGRKGSIGEVHLSEHPCWPIDTTYYIDQFHGQPINFWFYRLKALSLEQLNRASAIPGLNREDAYKLPIALPPLNEQRRIVAKIEVLRARSQRAKEALEAIPPLLDQFRQSVLAAAFCGDLTADWREQNPDVEPVAKLLEQLKDKRFNQAETSLQQRKLSEVYSYQEEENSDLLPQTWQYSTLEKLCKSFQYGTSTKSLSSGRVPVLRMGNLQNGQIDWTDLVYTSDEEEITKYNLEPGDVLFNRTNSPELVGKTGIYCGEYPAIFAGYLIKINNYEEIDSEYLNYCLNTAYAKDYCWKVKTDGVSQSNINAQKLGKFEIPLCSTEEQKEIVHRVKSLFKLADRVDQRFQEVRANLDQLNQSILAKAFRGELVPQDPNDEPASVLLERIRVERTKKEAEAKAAKTKGNRGRRKINQVDLSEQISLPGLE